MLRRKLFPPTVAILLISGCSVDYDPDATRIGPRPPRSVDAWAHDVTQRLLEQRREERDRELLRAWRRVGHVLARRELATIPPRTIVRCQNCKDLAYWADWERPKYDSYACPKCLHLNHPPDVIPADTSKAVYPLMTEQEWSDVENIVE